MRSEPLERLSTVDALDHAFAPPSAKRRPRGWIPRRVRRLASRLLAVLSRRESLRLPDRPRNGLRWSRFPPDQPPWARAVREVALRCLVFPLVRLLYQVHVAGRPHLDGIKEPLIIAANHCLHLDNPLILMALPPSVRRTTAIAAAEDSIFANWRGRWAALLGNAFPISRGRAPRRSLARIEAVLAEGYSVLIYPEGKLTVGGPMQPFKLGVGFLATETGAPVVPVFLDVRRFGPAEGKLWPPRGSVRIAIGQPIAFGRDESPSAATSRIESAIRALATP
ncbi:MAG: hypothetical protein KatS3mg060_1400 [Dehalococcoidia bacterium]|nr:MAG: hypothetical protein KatS3mg060_1400 [Dehalococcoidia bacterium]